MESESSLIITNTSLNGGSWSFKYECKCTNIGARMSFKVNPSESRKINANMIASVDECEYWYGFERESE